MMHIVRYKVASIELLNTRRYFNKLYFAFELYSFFVHFNFSPHFLSFFVSNDYLFRVLF